MGHLGSSRCLWGFCVWSLFCYLLRGVLSCNLLDGEWRAGCFTLVFFYMSCDCMCSVAVRRGTSGWSAICGGSFLIILTYIVYHMATRV